MSMCCVRCSECLQDFLLNHSNIGTLTGICVYSPIMFVLFLIFILQLPFSIIYHLCCCKCSTNKKYQPLKDSDEIEVNSDSQELELNHETVILINNANEKSQTDKTGDTTDDDRIQISILNYNLFVYFGRFWTRYPLLYSTIEELSPDILCFQEAINSKLFFFGTQNMVFSIFRKNSISKLNTNGFFNNGVCSRLRKSNPVLFGKFDSFFWVVPELQLLMNIYFLLPFLRQSLWRASLGFQKCVIYIGIALIGIPLNFGNCTIFRDNDQLNKDILLLPKWLSAIRTLYVKKKKKIWIVNTHLITQAIEDCNIEEEQLHECQLILDWMKDAMENVCQADAIIICGDFNSFPDSANYSLMTENGYRSCACEKFGGNSTENHYCTYESKSWTFAKGVDDGVGKISILDYIWIKGENITVDDVQIVGKKFVNTKHKNEDIRIYPSDHYGIFAQITI